MASRIGDLGRNLQNIVSLIAQYEDALVEAEEILRFKGKTVGEANKEQMFVFTYDEKLVELNTLAKYVDSKINQIRGSKAQQIKELNTRDLSDRMIDKYIDADDEYQKMYELYLEITDMRDKFSSVVESFKARGFALRNINDAKSKQFDTDVL